MGKKSKRTPEPPQPRPGWFGPLATVMIMRRKADPWDDGEPDGNGSGELVKRLRDRRRNVWEQLSYLAETAEVENRRFSQEEQGTWEVWNEELDELDRRIKNALDAEFREDQNAKLTSEPGETSRRLTNRRRNVWDQCLRLADEAATENRAFSAEESGTWMVLAEELENLDERLSGALEQDQRGVQTEEAFARLRAEKGTEPFDRTKRLRDRRLFMWEHLKELAETASKDGRAFTPREQGTWAVLREQMAGLDTRVREELTAVPAG